MTSPAVHVAFVNKWVEEKTWCPSCEMSGIKISSADWLCLESFLRQLQLASLLSPQSCFMSQAFPRRFKDVFVNPSDGCLDVLIALVPLPRLDSLASFSALFATALPEAFGNEWCGLC